MIKYFKDLLATLKRIESVLEDIHTHLHKMESVVQEAPTTRSGAEKRKYLRVWPK